MNRLRELRKQSGLTMKQIGYHFGLAESTISNYESGKREPEYSILLKMADYYHVTVDYLLGNDEKLPSGAVPLHTVPVIGKIACGSPVEEAEDYSGEIPLPEGIHADFALICAGDSMEPAIHSGDYVLIRKQYDVSNGQIAAVSINGETTLKRLRHIKDGVALVADNPNYDMIIAQKCDIRVEGLAVGYIHIFA